eukprot:4449536-Alexandrium_andersonii.AAC.1
MSGGVARRHAAAGGRRRRRCGPASAQRPSAELQVGPGAPGQGGCRSAAPWSHWEPAPLAPAAGSARRGMGAGHTASGQRPGR